MFDLFFSFFSFFLFCLFFLFFLFFSSASAQVVALVNSRRGFRRSVKLRKKMLVSRAKEYDLLENGDYTNGEDALVSSSSGSDSGESDSPDEEEPEEPVEEDAEEEVEEEAAAPPSGPVDAKKAAMLALSGYGKKEEVVVPLQYIKLQKVKKKIAYNEDALEASRVRHRLPTAFPLPFLGLTPPCHCLSLALHRLVTAFP